MSTPQAIDAASRTDEELLAILRNRGVAAPPGVDAACDELARRLRDRGQQRSAAADDLRDQPMPRKCDAAGDQAWRDREQLHSGIFSLISDAVMVLDPQRQIVFWNEAAARLWKRSAQEVIGKNANDVLTYTLADGESMDHIRAVLDSGKVWRGDGFHQVGDTQLIVESTLSRLRDAQGREVGTLAIMHEVTAERRIQEALRESQLRFEAFMRFSPTFAYIKDEEGRYVWVSPTMERTFNTPLAGWIGKRVEDFLDADAARVMKQDDEAVLASGQPMREERVFVIRGVQTNWMTYKFPIVSAKQRYVAGVSLDITDRERALAALRSSERHYKEAAQRNRLLLQELDHRVRNNLAALSGLICIMRDRTHDMNELAEALDGRVRAMAHVQDLLSKSQYGSIRLRVLIASLFQTMQALATHRASTAIQGPDVMIRPRQLMPLGMVLLEWFTNSCKYGANSSPAGRLEISWELTPCAIGCEPGCTTCIDLYWRECCGPAIVAPIKESLGTELVRNLVKVELKGTVWLNYPQAGADHRLQFGLAREDEPGMPELPTIDSSLRTPLGAKPL